MDSILCYPTSEFRDLAWLKASLLVWDRIYRIVPASFVPNDGDELGITASDLLNQNNNVSRLVTKSYVQDTRNLVLGPYVVLMFTYTIR